MRMAAMAHLKPCPFCGGEAKFSRIPGEGFSVVCSNCGAIAIREKSKDRDSLGNAWNLRQVRHNFSVTDQLKPCPFCASRLSLGKMPSNGSILACSKCGMMVSFIDSGDLKTTVARWNRRTAEPIR